MLNNLSHEDEIVNLKNRVHELEEAMEFIERLLISKEKRIHLLEKTIKDILSLTRRFNSEHGGIK